MVLVMRMAVAVVIVAGVVVPVVVAARARLGWFVAVAVVHGARTALCHGLLRFPAHHSTPTVCPTTTGPGNARYMKRISMLRDWRRPPNRPAAAASERPPPRQLAVGTAAERQLADQDVVEVALPEPAVGDTSACGMVNANARAIEIAPQTRRLIRSGVICPTSVRSPPGRAMWQVRQVRHTGTTTSS